MKTKVLTLRKYGCEEQNNSPAIFSFVVIVITFCCRKHTHTQFVKHIQKRLFSNDLELDLFALDPLSGYWSETTMTNSQIQFFSAFFALQFTNDQIETFALNKHNRSRFPIVRTAFSRRISGHFFLYTFRLFYVTFVFVQLMIMVACRLLSEESMKMRTSK